MPFSYPFILLIYIQISCTLGQRTSVGRLIYIKNNIVQRTAKGKRGIALWPCWTILKSDILLEKAQEPRSGSKK